MRLASVTSLDGRGRSSERRSTRGDGVRRAAVRASAREAAGDRRHGGRLVGVVCADEREQCGLAHVLRTVRLHDGPRPLLLRHAARGDACSDADPAWPGGEAVGVAGRGMGGAPRRGVRSRRRRRSRRPADGGIRPSGLALAVDRLPDRSPDGHLARDLGPRSRRALLLDRLRRAQIRPAADRPRRHRRRREHAHAGTDLPGGGVANLRREPAQPARCGASGKRSVRSGKLRSARRRGRATC
jgi:hypothetical protein